MIVLLKRDYSTKRPQKTSLRLMPWAISEPLCSGGRGGRQIKSYDFRVRDRTDIGRSVCIAARKEIQFHFVCDIAASA